MTVSVLQSLNKLFVNFGGHESYLWYNFHPLFPLITCQIMGYKSYPGTDTIATTDHQAMRCKKLKDIPFQMENSTLY